MEFLIFVLIALIIHPYTIYPLSLVILNKCSRHKKMSYMEETKPYPRLSLLVAAYNEEKVITEKLANSISLDYPKEKLEIIVGSDGSTDRTNLIVQSYATTYSNVRLLAYNQREGKVNVINKSIPLCSGEIVVLSDANALYNKKALKNIVRHFSLKHVGCVAGEKRIRSFNAQDTIGKNEGLYWRLEAFIKKQESRAKTVIGADGALYAIKRNLFKQLPKDTSVDDFLLSMFIVMQGYSIVYEPDAYSYEDAGNSLNDEFKRKVRIAAGNFYNFRFLREIINFSLLSYMFISHKLLRWLSPYIFGLLTLCLMINAINPYYFLLFILLLSSYIIAILGSLFEKILLENKLISLITHFYLTVFAQLIGFIKYHKGVQKAVWDTIRK